MSELRSHIAPLFTLKFPMLPSQPDRLGWSSYPACGIQVLLCPNGQKHINNYKELLIPVQRNQSTVQSSLMEESIMSIQTCWCAKALPLRCFLYFVLLIFFHLKP